MARERMGALQRAIIDYLEIVGPVLLHPANLPGRPSNYTDNQPLTSWPAGSPPMARTTQAERRAIAGLQRKGRVVVDTVTHGRLAWTRLALAGEEQE